MRQREHPTHEGKNPCPVCAHPERRLIEDALAMGKVARSVAEAFELPTAAVHRHRLNHMIRRQVAQSLSIPEGETVLDAIKRKRLEVERIAHEAYLSGGLKTSLDGMGVFARFIELEAKLTGLLQEQATVVIQSSPQAMAFLGRILSALAPYHEAREAVCRALEGLLPIEATPIPVPPALDAVQDDTRSGTPEPGRDD